MRLARPIISALVVLGLSLIGLHFGPVLAQAADITDLQAGLIAGAAITWAAFQVTSLLDNVEPPTTDHQD